MNSSRQKTLALFALILCVLFADVSSVTAEQPESAVAKSEIAPVVESGATGLDDHHVATGALMDGDRDERGMGVLDWGIIVFYAIGMISVGRFYSRRVRTMEDYLLGGRHMKPWAVGISLFAALVSSISFLATPGEMIKHGPMVFCDLLALPFVAIIVGWFIIPHFMKLKVTSANEILEMRLGVYVRTLGAVLFLCLRFLWMAVILYATASKVLVPLLGWEASTTPMLCIVLGVITILYTSEGGIQAVVITDVIQSFVLLSGAILAIVLITVDLGGVGKWWPTEWLTTWDPPKLWFDPQARVTVAMAALSGFSWFLCTAASDQMTIQRFLTTRDVKSARRMYNISLAANAVVVVLLACLGMALLAWFKLHPDKLGPKLSIVENSDQLLPRYIVISLPHGAKGTLLAALLAAAMSALSSGINSTCTVITVDFVERFQKNADGEMDHVRTAKRISWFVGVIVVLLSLAAIVVPGNLLEVTYRLSNLLVGPLFVIFFIAMFVPWATSVGAFVGALAGAVAAILISFYQIFGLSFLCIVPGSAIVGVGVGVVLSALTYKTRLIRQRLTRPLEKSVANRSL
jgi:SSS family solute:Na+ symporter